MTDVERLLGIVGVLHSDLDLPAKLRRVSEVARDLLGGDSAAVVTVRSDSLEIRVVTEPEYDHPLPYAHTTMAALDAAAADVLVVATADYPGITAWLTARGLELPVLAVARVVVHGQTRGALYVFFSSASRNLDPAELLTLELLAGHAGAVLAHAAVVQQRDRGRAILASLADGVAVVTEAGDVVWWNAAAGQITGVPEAEALGRPLPFPLTEHGVQVEHRLPDGRWLEAVCSPLSDMDPPETVVTFRDVTAAKLVEDAKSLFLATTGHELRTPLTVIRGFTGTLIERWDALTDAERREAVGVIAARAEGLGLLVEQVLASSHAEAGERRLERRPLALGPLLTAAAVDVGSLSSRHDVTVLVDDGLSLVPADEQALRTVIGLLVDNAVKYSPDGGLVALSAAPSEDGESVCIRVDDEGIGVATQDQDRVFDRFFQANAADSRPSGGFGLGLYIVRRLVEAHDGSVTLRPRPDRRTGSRAELRLPLTMTK